MTLTDLTPNWVLVCTVLLVAGLVAVFLLARGRRKREDGAPADSWERMEQRRRRKETVYAMASYLLLFCCAAVAAALSFHGLVGFGRQNLNLSGGWEYLVPFGLDGAAMFSAMIAVREASHGDASLGSRLLVWTFAAAAAWFNWVHAPRGDEHAGAPQFFAGMSLSAAILFDRALKQTRRAALREQGLVPRPLPQIRVVRWLRAPRETFRAWSLMLLEGVRSLDEAVDEVRDEQRRREEDRRRRKEQDKLERARLKALNRQHRLWGRSSGNASPLEVEIGAPTSSAPSGDAAARNRPALQPAALDVEVEEEAAGVAGAEPRPPGPRSPADDRAPGDHTEAEAESGSSDESLSSQASPRLDSLEEKLRQIEKQFG
ncbi:DUF2637 domain-containing protein [Streptomyces sp. TR06-5]|uniref:DUF2637 domain-containing protein n=1 Tax=unclassified Streptomyces TaxID=2593676 RepID=UPI0039A08140